MPYWIVKNSWGSDFGDHGYLYIKIGDNLCGEFCEIICSVVDSRIYEKLKVFSSELCKNI